MWLRNSTFYTSSRFVRVLAKEIHFFLSSALNHATKVFSLKFFFLPFPTDDKYHLQNYPPIISEHSQHGHHFALNQYKSAEQQSNSNQPIDEPNNNSKNNSSASSYDDTIDYDDSIQNQDLKDSQMLKKAPADADNLKYMKNFASRNHFEDHQTTYNGVAAVSDDYRMTNIDERKMNEDGNSSMNYASSDEMNQNAATSDHGEKLGSGSEDEGKEICT